MKRIRPALGLPVFLAFLLVESSAGASPYRAPINQRSSPSPLDRLMEKPGGASADRDLNSSGSLLLETDLETGRAPNALWFAHRLIELDAKLSIPGRALQQELTTDRGIAPTTSALAAFDPALASAFAAALGFGLSFPTRASPQSSPAAETKADGLWAAAKEVPLPELDSFALLSTGILTAVGGLWARRRLRRRAHSGSQSLGAVEPSLLTSPL